MRLHQIRVQGQYLFQLDDGQILTALLTVQQRLVVFLNGLVDGLQSGRIRLNRVDIFFSGSRFLLMIHSVRADTTSPTS